MLSDLTTEAAGLGQALAAWAQVIGNVAIPIIGLIVTSYLRSKHVNSTIIEALGRAAGEANLVIERSGKHITDPGVLAAAVKAGSDYMFSTVSESLAARDKDAQGVAMMVQAELGRQRALSPVGTVQPAPESTSDAQAAELPPMVAAAPESPVPVMIPVPEVSTPTTEAPTPIRLSPDAVVVSDGSVDRLADTIAARVAAVLRSVPAPVSETIAAAPS